MKIEFEWAKFEEEEIWEALFVRINDGKWILAKQAFNTENEELIKEIVESNGKAHQ